MTNRTDERVTAYVESFPEPIRAILIQTRQVLLQAVPDATEDMKYGMPTLRLNGNLIHYGANKSHLGIYPSPEGIEAFSNELKGYVTSKGAIQFPYDKPIPFDLIVAIAMQRAKIHRELKKR
jgi:uncharacterized protein YdhG (YjbR/CyaY superfamily)